MDFIVGNQQQATVALKLFRAQFFFSRSFSVSRTLKHTLFAVPGVAGLETAHTGNFSYTKRIRDLTTPTN